MTEQRVYTKEEFFALPDEEKIPGMLIDYGEEGRFDYLKYTFEAVTDENGIITFDEKKIPANVNQVFGFDTEFYTFSPEQENDIEFYPEVTLGEKINNLQKFTGTFRCNKPNTPVKITFEYL